VNNYWIYITVYFVASLVFVAFFGLAQLPERFRLGINRSYLPEKKLLYPVLLLPFLAIVDHEMYEEFLSIILFIYAVTTLRTINAEKVSLATS